MQQSALIKMTWIEVLQRDTAPSICLDRQVYFTSESLLCIAVRDWLHSSGSRRRRWFCGGDGIDACDGDRDDEVDGSDNCGNHDDGDGDGHDGDGNSQEAL